MIKLRVAGDRGHTKLDWLDSYHAFSFDQYYDSNWMGFRALRVINDDKIETARGFEFHPHSNMEIITFIIDGSLEHKDSMGNGSVITRGEIQRMTAGTGVMHSEFNPSTSEVVHLLQIWIIPNKKGLDPSYEQKKLKLADRCGRLMLVASMDGRNQSVTIHQDVDLYSTILQPGEYIRQALKDNRYGWLQVAKGSLTLNGISMSPGDGASIENEKNIEIYSLDFSEALFFDMS